MIKTGYTETWDVGSLLRGILRRWPLWLGLPLLVAGLSWLRQTPPSTTAQARITVAIDVPPSVQVAGSDEGTSAKIGEALIDDLARILPGDAFAAAVQARLPEGVSVREGESSGSLSADDRHRVMDVSVTRTVDGAADVNALRSDLALVAQAVVAELEEDGDRWLALLGSDGVRLNVVDGPEVVILPASLQRRIELPLRILLALLIALGFSLVLHLQDPRIYGATAAEAAAGAPVIGSIPRSRRAHRVKDPSP